MERKKLKQPLNDLPNIGLCEKAKTLLSEIQNK